MMVEERGSFYYLYGSSDKRFSLFSLWNHIQSQGGWQTHGSKLLGISKLTVTLLSFEWAAETERWRRPLKLQFSSQAGAPWDESRCKRGDRIYCYCWTSDIYIQGLITSSWIFFQFSWHRRQHHSNILKHQMLHLKLLHSPISIFRYFLYGDDFLYLLSEPSISLTGGCDDWIAPPFDRR